MTHPDTIFTVRPDSLDSKARKAAALAAPLLDRLLAFHKINALYQHARSRGSREEFSRNLLESLEVRVDISAEDIKRIPSSGPVIVAVNHPFGLLDPLALYTVLKGVRPDVKIIANHLLAKIPELHDFCIFVDPFAGNSATSANSRPLRQTIEWLRKGGMIAIFPAGEVASLKARELKVIEPEWNPILSRLLDHVKASVLPAFFKGTNKPGFHLSGLIHPRLRTALLPYEFLNKRGHAVELAVGFPISHSRLAAIESHSDRTEFIRGRVFNLKNRWRSKTVSLNGQEKNLEPIAPASDPQILENEIRNLPESVLLVRSEQVSVYCAPARDIPAVMQEIGRQRELTFRDVGEGTGKRLDLDRFDDHYLHLFAWNHSNSELVGAYRIGQLDKLLMSGGSQSIYTNSLFKIKPELLSRLSPALELGRSFITRDYQRTRFALALLWKGLAAYVARNPQYSRLFGPVSISSSYLSMSHRLMIEFLREYYFLEEESKLVSSRLGHPLTEVSRSKYLRRVQASAGQVEDFSAIISDLEWDGKGIPVLIREYLKLGGRILGFNVDKNFSNVIDALILVDLRYTNRRVLDWYMGKEAAAKFLVFHEQSLASHLAA